MTGSSCRASILVSVALAQGALAAAAGPAPDYARDVAPLFERHCVECHGAAKQESLLRLDSLKETLAGGMSGDSVVPGRSAESLLVKHLRGEAKPAMPHRRPPLADDEIARIAAWIDAGAPGPAGAPAPVASHERAPRPAHWAYLPPARPALPASMSRPAWVRNPVDAFVLARLDREGLAPSPEADRETLVRRLFLDLVGLPPAPEEIDAFLADARADAYERLVDRLLASPRYGERWARPWLDLARYADTNGYEKDQARTAWRWRDWVIDALNRDQSFRDFTIEQLAGDMLPGATDAQRIATGFHRNTLLNQEGGIDVEEARFETLVDRVNTTATVWLGSTVACAQCHNHKFDPVTQKDYYRLLAFFDNSEYRVHGEGDTVMDRWILEPEIEFPTAEETARRAALRREAADPATAPARLEAIGKELEGIEVATTPVMEERPGFERPSTLLRERGSFTSPGERVYAAVPPAFGALPDDQPPNRLGLARWLVSPDNPLTARVTVNRIWQTVFGRGLVATAEDFGAQGERPSHPELLDWLAVELVEKGWSQKTLLRTIVTSATYRQSSVTAPALRERDPENRLLARAPRYRLEAEAVRDVALAASSLLSPRIGGPSVFPEQPDGIWNVPYSAMKWETSPGEDRYRRSLYTFLRRSSPYPGLVAFDAPSREQCTVRRVPTNTPLQALTSLNDPVLVEAARALAGRAIAEAGPGPRERIAHGYRLCAGRRPGRADLDSLVAFHDREKARFDADPSQARALLATAAPGPDATERAALTMVANVLLSMDATLTRE